MGDAWVVDLTHYDGVETPGSGVPRAAIRIARYWCSIVQHATSSPLRGGPMVTELRCRRRPGRKPCPGHIVVAIWSAPSYIEWTCSHCGDNWRGSQWDQSETTE